MLEIIVPSREFYDEKKNKIVETKEQVLHLEHSLVSISKWEAKYHKPFISKDQKTPEELNDYVRFMTKTQNVDPKIYLSLTKDNYKKINEYIDNPSTATTFTDRSPNDKNKKQSSIITSELIYYWMVSFQIPFECQTWHLNRLLTLIRICNVKNNANNKGGKMSKKEILSQNKALNAARRKQLNSRG